MSTHTIIYKISRRMLVFLANILVGIVSLVVPKSRRIYVVGGWFGKRFADNSKYFFLYANHDKDKLGIKKIVWITRSQHIRDELRRAGYCAYMVWSLGSLWYHLRAKIHIVDQCDADINPWFSVRSIRINMWHGFPLKKIGTFIDPAHKTGTMYALFSYLTSPGFWRRLYILGTSEFAAQVMGEAFDTPEARRIVAGYPRDYEPVVQNAIKYAADNERPYLEQIRQAKESGKSIVACLPTFRDNSKTMFFGSEDKAQILDLLDFLQEKNILLIGKFHFGGKNDSFNLLASHEAFINLPSETDLYTYISEMDMLITDYSSICLDFLVWKKPMFFYPYDLDYYANSDRGLLFEYNELTPGPKVTSIDGVKELLAGGIKGFSKKYFDEYSQVADEVRIKIFGDASKMTIDDFIRKINEL